MQSPTKSAPFPLILATLLAPCCSASPGGQERDNTVPEGAASSRAAAPDSASSPNDGTMIVLPPPSAGAGGSPSSGNPVPLGTLPPGPHVVADVGKYMLGPPIAAAGVTDTGLDSAAGCNVVVGVVRDFRGAGEAGGHADFEAFSGWDVTPGLIGAELGPNAKPVYSAKCQGAGVTTDCPFGQQTTSAAGFEQWFHYTQGINQPYLIYFEFEPTGGNIVTFDSQLFFPLDGQGFGNSGAGEDGQQHNFNFTTELHTKFQYNGGETFKFIGDDDLWVFVNGKLVLDVGGLHPAVSRAIDMDAFAQALGLIKGGVYSLELFHAERHTIASHFRIESTLTLVDCGTVPPEVVK